ncbi:MAG: hypothetical protein WCF18_07110 [Chthoniobacteraceae bacterium]
MLILAQAVTTRDGPLDAVAAFARQLFAERSAYDLGSMCGALVLAAIIQVLAYWISAKVVVANERATLARAGQLWLLSVLVGVGMSLLLVVCVLLAASTQQPALVLLVGGGWLLLACVIALLLPAKVFETDLSRSFGILLLSFILTVAGQTALDQARGHSTLARWRPLQRLIFDSNEGRQRRLKHLLARDPLATIESDLDRLSSPDERKKSFSERQGGLRAAFAALEQRRKTIKADDKESLASYEALRQRYEELVKIMRADYAASQASPAPTPAVP